MIKVLHVINWLRRGGVETQLLQILRDYDRSRFQMDVCCFGSEIGYLAPQALQYGADITHCPKSANLYSFSKRFHNLIEKRKYDIVHCHSEAWSGPILRGAKQTGVPVRIAHIRSSLPQGFRIKSLFIKLARNFIIAWGRCWLFKYATHIFGVSASSLDARFPQWKNNKRFYVWTLGVDTEKFSPPVNRSGLNRNKPVLINVGSFILQRRQDLILNIHALILKKMPGAKLILVGEGEQMQKCMSLARTLGIHDRVNFLGLRDDIPGLLRNADIFISCSEAEGLPNVLLEAQSAGLPVVASDIPSHREALPQAAHPFLFKSTGPRLAAENVIRLFDNPRIYSALSRDGRDYVVRHFNAKNSLRRLEEMCLNWVEENKEPPLSF